MREIIHRANLVMAVVYKNVPLLLFSNRTARFFLSLFVTASHGHAKINDPLIIPVTEKALIS